MSVRGQDNEMHESETRLAGPWSNALWSIPLVLPSLLFVMATIEAAFGDMPGSRAANLLQTFSLAAGFTVLAVRALRRGVVLSDHQLSARRLFRTRHHRWDTIEGFGLDFIDADDEFQGGMFLEMVLRDGSSRAEERTYRLPVGGGLVWRHGDAGRARRLRQFAALLNSELRRHTSEEPTGGKS